MPYNFRNQMTTVQKSSPNLNFSHFDNAPFPIAIFLAPALTLQFYNKLASPLLNKDLVDPIGKTFLQTLKEFINEDTQTLILEQCLTKNATYSVTERPFVQEDKNIPPQWFDITFVPLHYEETIAGFICYFADVTDRVTNKRYLRHQQDYLADFFRQAPIAIVCYRGEEFIVDVANESALEMWGKSLEDVKGKPIVQIFPEVETNPEIKKRHNESLERFRKGESHIVNEVELTFVRNGKPHVGWYNYIHEPYRDETGKRVGMMAVAIEVTEQVLARKKLQLITDALPSRVSYVNSNGNFEFVNKAYENWFGRPINKILGQPVESLIGADAYKKIEQQIAAALYGKESTIETWINDGSGNDRYISATFIPHVEGNRVKGYIGLENDLTERKKSEEAVLASEAKIRLIIEGISAGTWEFNLLTGELHWSDELKSLLGFPKDFVTDVETSQSIVHPDDLESVLKQFYKLLDREDEGEYAAYDYRIFRKDTGEVRWIHSRSKILFVNKIASIAIGFSIDITDKKIAEEKLKVFNQQLEHRIQERTAELAVVNKQFEEAQKLAKLGSWEWNIVTGEVIWSAEMYRIYGYAENLPMDFARATERMSQRDATESNTRTQKHMQQAMAQFAQTSQVNYEIPSVEFPIVLPDGNRKILRSTARLQLSNEGQVQRLLGAVQDVTDIRAAEKAVLEKTLLLDSVLKNSTNGISVSKLIFNDAGKVVDAQTILANDAAIKYTGLPKDEYLTKPATYFDPNIIASAYGQACINTLLTGEPFIMRYFLDFSNRWLEVTVSKMDESHLIHIFTDVTTIREAEVKLEKTLEELRYTNTNLEEFAYAASHDLKEPIRKAQYFVSRLRDTLSSNTTESNNKLFEKLDKCHARMQRLVEDLLEYSQAAKGSTEKVVIDLNDEIHNVLDVLELEVQRKSATIEVQSLPKIYGDRRHIQQMFQNLIGNALKYSNPTTASQIKITCETVLGQSLVPALKTPRPDLPYYHIKVKDNGIGFDQEYAEKIFQVFTRLHADEAPGSGIGLSIVKKVVENHNGYVWAESEAGNGSTFNIVFPISEV